MPAQQRESQCQDVVACHHRNRGPVARKHLRQLCIRAGRDSFPRRACLIELAQKRAAKSAGLAQNKDSRPRIQRRLASGRRRGRRGEQGPIGSQRRGARTWRVRFLIPLSIRACGFPAHGLPMIFLMVTTRIPGSERCRASGRDHGPRTTHASRPPTGRGGDVGRSVSASGRPVATRHSGRSD
jgi:hypothetical protein